MDFKKIENIFLLAFVLLNIYLLVSFISRTDLQYATTNPTQDFTSDMRDRGIEYPQTLPEVESEVYYMQADANMLLEDNAESLENQAGSIDSEGTLYTSILSDPIELEGNPEDGFTEADLTLLDEFVNSSSVLFGEQYDYLRYDREGNRFIYGQMVNGIPIGDGTSEISLYYGGDGNIISYQQTYAGPMKEQGSSDELITAERAIEILFQNNELASGSKVETPILAYQRTLNLENLSMYGPIWLVPVTNSNESEVFRVDAVDTNGRILSDPTDTPALEESDESEDASSEDTSEVEEPIEAEE
ncbi:hypothetical protein BKP56_02745 [Marinilactibacillus sp. 15R]|uniref:Two-component signal transduction system YycFG, regulatory protein YycI n=1 Tax=Marinilactibacillus piezotolerans TaxID=258723 RepID=A0A1I3XM44_9LACT|nr:MULTISPECIES: two-component system regulatory protein YycI [Marinilactibacillus]API88285.1 hypothetical protein BKP56_02745 [Marinilactibacillus sp. 15R]SFK20592.1 Two-component signal transduction system YycFG, regulatory protein YycI [Marinilactibacillus piezotolerans]